MIEIINIAMALVSIGLGLFGWLAPRYTMQVVDLVDGGSTMGLSETRAASGALFVFVGVGALVLGTPAAFAMLGFAWGGGAIGRATSLILDGQTPKKWLYFWVEAAVAIIAIGGNLAHL